ncbi:MAG TPA: MFS transporter [Rhodocyclaceae bacterium]|nr:MFS transporter [Rhodocyclaceae bacterium]
MQRSYLASLSAMLGICLTITLIALDSTVVGTALPRVVAELQGYSLYPWIASAYLMTNAIMIPITGRLGYLYGRKPFVLAAIVLFTLASVLCGMAQTMMQLVLARGLQGVGGGMLVGVAFASVSDLFPVQLDRVRWQAMLSATFGIATAVGPALGGWMTEHLGWRSVFYVNVPVALISFPVIWKCLPHIVHHESNDKSIDWLGALLLAAGVCALLVATEKGPALGFTSLIFIGLIVLAASALVLFVWHQHHTSAPIIPARLFGSSAVRKLSLLGALTGLTMFVLVFYSPLMLQGGFNLSPNQAGLMITPLLVFITIGSLINGRLLPRLRRPERLISWGMVLLFIGCLLLTLFTQHTPQRLGMALFALCGLSLGFQLPNLTLQIQTVVLPRDLGAASALIQTTRMLGSMIGTSLGGVLVNLTYAREVAQTLVREKITDSQVSQLLRSPQVLIREQDQDTLQKLASTLNFNVERLLEQARVGLVSGIHHAYIACAFIVVVSFVISLRLPPFVLHAKNKGHADQTHASLE